MNHFSRRHFLRTALLACGVLPACSRPPEVVSDIDYYTCSMHPSVHEHAPGECPICGMDLTPVLKKGAVSPDASAHEFTVPVARQQQIGVTTAVLARGPLERTVRAVGMVKYDLRRHWAFVARADGFVTQLFVTSPGEQVEKDQPLLTIYSPEILTTQRELVQMLGLPGTPPRLIESARTRLRQWNLTEAQIAAITKDSEPAEEVTFRSPFRGVISEVPAHQGVAVKVGDHLVDIADLSEVWLWAEFYEEELALLRLGQNVTVTTKAYPGEKFAGKIVVIDPFIDEMKRTTRVRIDLPNADYRLHPGMYAAVEMTVTRGEGLRLPVNAVMPTGQRNIVFVQHADGLLEPRSIKLGGQFGDFYEVKAGLAAGETVIASAMFLIDAEAQVQGALKNFTEPPVRNLQP